MEAFSHKRLFVRLIESMFIILNSVIGLEGNIVLKFEWAFGVILLVLAFYELWSLRKYDKRKD